VTHLTGKTALITGSTSGIGLAIAEAFAASGAGVVLNGFGDPEQIEVTRAGLAGEHGIKATYSGADMSKAQQIADLVAEAEAAHGAVDIVVNKAGIQHVAPIDEFPLYKWDAIIAINMVGNVWEWTSELYRIRSLKKHLKHRLEGMKGYNLSKGGSLLCHRSYRYRIAARSGTSPDSATTNHGFRVVWDR
jgi:NAD(P)-dependent dehydrogenase (short-subunit alcohol dehydrogenase family)